MKLGKLNAAIRGLKHAPKISPKFRPDDLTIELVDLEITKQSLLNAIKVAFPDAAKNAETNLYINAAGHLTTDDGEREAGEEPAAADEPATDDLDDILG